MKTKNDTAVAMAEETAATLQHDSVSEIEQMARMKAEIVALQHTNASELKTKVDLIRSKADSQPLASVLNDSISKIADMQRRMPRQSWRRLTSSWRLLRHTISEPTVLTTETRCAATLSGLLPMWRRSESCKTK
jgi:hypothetical protein